MQQLNRNLQRIEPVVQHGIRELRGGAPVDHVLREATLMGALIGSGLNPSQAIRTVEQVERQILSYGGWERVETQYHGAPGRQQYGYGQPYGAPNVYGQQQMPMTYGPMGGTWMGQ